MSRIILDSVAVEAGDVTFGVRHLLRHTLRVEVRFNSNLDGIRIGMRIAEALGAEDSSGPIELEEGDWEKLTDSLRSPSTMTGALPYPLNPGHANIPLIDAVLNAQKKPKNE